MIERMPGENRWDPDAGQASEPGDQLQVEATRCEELRYRIVASAHVLHPAVVDGVVDVEQVEDLHRQPQVLDRLEEVALLLARRAQELLAEADVHAPVEVGAQRV